MQDITLGQYRELPKLSPTANNKSLQFPKINNSDSQAHRSDLPGWHIAAYEKEKEIQFNDDYLSEQKHQICL